MFPSNRIVTFQIKPFSTSMIMGERVKPKKARFVVGDFGIFGYRGGISGQISILNLN